MSLEAINWVLRDAPDVPAQCVSVLVGLAWHADKRGRGAYPSAGTLSGFARKSERQVRYDISLLTEAKLIRPGDQSLTRNLPMNRRPVVYDLAVERSAADIEVQPTAPLAGVQSASGVQPTAPLQPTAPQSANDLQGRAGVQPTAPQTADSLGCNTAQPGVQPTADKPSLNLRPSEVQVGEGGSGGEGGALFGAPSPSANGHGRSEPAKVTAHRIPADFKVTPEMVTWARANVPKVDGRRATDAFIDHWTSAGGSNARKRDWVAAWRNWMRKADDDLAAAERRRNFPRSDASSQSSPRDEHRMRR